MKKLFFLLFCGIASYSFCGQLSWAAANFSTPFSGGTAYLIETKSTTASVDTISNYLKTTGISYSGNEFAQKGNSGKIVTDGDSVLVDEVIAGTVSTEDNSKKVFLVAFTADSKEFALSALETINVKGDENMFINFGETGTTYWTTGKVYSDKPVPEPGMLALLALGVAGLALRRKVA